MWTVNWDLSVSTTVFNCQNDHVDNTYMIEEKKKLETENLLQHNFSISVYHNKKPQNIQLIL